MYNKLALLMLRRIGTIFNRSTQSSQFQENEKLENLMRNTQNELIKVKTVFPFDFFPDTLSIDPVKVSFIHKIFFSSEEIKTILIEDMGHVILSSGPIFATLTIVDSVYSANKIVMKPLYKQDAIKAQSILQGLIVSKKEHVDPTKFPTTQEVVANIEELGKGKWTAS